MSQESINRNVQQLLQQIQQILQQLQQQQLLQQLQQILQQQPQQQSLLGRLLQPVEGILTTVTGLLSPPQQQQQQPLLQQIQPLLQQQQPSVQQIQPLLQQIPLLLQQRMIYGYSMTVGPDCKREFGNVKRSRFGFGGMSAPEVTGEIEPLVEVITTDSEVKVVVEMPGISKDKIKINVHDNTVEVRSEDRQRKYHRTIEIPPESNIETATSSYNNGILEITFKKKDRTKGKTVNV